MRPEKLIKDPDSKTMGKKQKRSSTRNTFLSCFKMYPGFYVWFIVHILAYANIKRAISDSKSTEVKSKEQSFQAVSFWCMGISIKVKGNLKKSKEKIQIKYS